jgi:hypothetical protein
MVRILQIMPHAWRATVPACPAFAEAASRRQALALTNSNFEKGEAGEKKWEDL